LDEYSSVPSTTVDCVRAHLQDATVKEVINSCPFTCRPANSEEPTVVSIGNGTRNLFAFTNIDIYTVVEGNYPNNTLAARPSNPQETSPGPLKAPEEACEVSPTKNKPSPLTNKKPIWRRPAKSVGEPHGSLTGQETIQQCLLLV
jgi:hypothetical protein